jgi:acyl-CoA thioesterase I
MKNSSLIALLLFAALCLPAFAHAEKNILIFGDSLSAGYGLDIKESWPHLLQQKLDRQGFKIVNASVSGETSLGGLKRITSLLKQYHPRIVILELGANDGLRGYATADTEKNLDAILLNIGKENAKVLLVGMKLPPNYGAPYIAQFQQMFAMLAKKHRIRLLPYLLEGVKADQFQADNLHPNAAAQPRIMGNVMQALKPLLH